MNKTVKWLNKAGYSLVIVCFAGGELPVTVEVRRCTMRNPETGKFTTPPEYVAQGINIERALRNAANLLVDDLPDEEDETPIPQTDKRSLGFGLCK